MKKKKIGNKKPHLYIKEQLNCVIYSNFPERAKMDTGKHYFLVSLHFLAFKQTKEQLLFKK